MLLARTKTWLMVLAVWASGAAAVFAQPAEPSHWSPFGPSSIRYDLELFKPPDLSTYGDWPRPAEGMYFQYERLYYSISQPNRTDVGVQGATATGLLNGVVNFDSTNQPIGNLLQTYGNSLDTGFLRADQTWGNRYDFGFIEDGKGWNISIMNLQDQIQSYSAGTATNPAGITIVFNDPHNLLLGFVDTNGDGFDDDLNASGPIGPFNRVPSVFGRPTGNTPINLDTNFDGVPDAFAGFTDFGDRVPLVPIFNTITIQNITSLNSVEVNRTWRYPPSHRGNIWTLNTGVRWMILRDAFNVDATATLGSTGAPPAQGPTSTGPFAPGLPGNSFWDTSVDNNMFGPQIALRWDHTAARWDVFADMRFMAAINFQSTHLNGELASFLDPIPRQPGQPVILQPLNPLNAPNEMVRTSFHQWQYDTEFAPVGEFRTGVNYKLTQAIAVQAGYNFIIGAGISRASRRLDYELPAIKILDGNKWDTFFTNGLSLGVTVNR
jgi:hypothetical protein